MQALRPIGTTPIQSPNVTSTAPTGATAPAAKASTSSDSVQLSGAAPTPAPVASLTDSLTASMNPHPKEIIIIRHGEKPGDPSMDNSSDGRGLSPQGQQRADALANAIPQRYPDIDYLFATAPSGSSDRPVLTITPLSQKLGLPINQMFADKQYNQLAQTLMTPQYDGKTVLICWHHGKIPQLAQALGVTPPQSPWPSQQFDRIWQIDYSSDGTPSVQNLPQNVLPGDSTN